MRGRRLLPGGVTLTRANARHRLGPANALTLDAAAISLSKPSADLELLEVALPG